MKLQNRETYKPSQDYADFLHSKNGLEAIVFKDETYGKFGDLTDRQKEERKKGIGGSDCAAVMKMSRYSTPLDIYNQKKGIGEVFEGNMKTDLGSYLEPFVLEKVRQKTGIDFVKPNKNIKVVHKEFPWMKCNLDFITKDKKICGEFKVVGESDDWGEEFTDKMPTEYLYQCAHNRITSASKFGIDYEFFYLFVLVFPKWGVPYIRQYIYRKNEKLEAQIIVVESHFWKTYVEKNVRPPFFTLEEASRHYKKVNDDAILASPHLLELAERRKEVALNIKQLKDNINNLEKTEEMIKVSIAEELKDNSQAIDIEGKNVVTWKQQERTSLDTKKVKEEFSEIYESCLRKTTFRTMRFAK